ncbi:hypothetical protein [Mediterraneibacter sp.]
MNKKGGNVIRIVLGVYLIYLGVSIFIEVVQKNPANSGFMGAAGGIFVIVGAVYAFLAAKKVFAEMKKEKNAKEEFSVSGLDRNEREESEKENKVNTREKITDKEMAGKEEEPAEKKADKEKMMTEEKVGKEEPAERDEVE